MLDAHDLRHMGGVAGQHLRRLPGRVRVDEGVVDIQPHYAAGVPDGPQLVVRQVPAHIAQAAAVGVGRDDRPPGQLHHIPKAPVVQVGHVHHHPQLPHPADRPPAQQGQPLFRVVPGAGGEGVFLVPGQHADPGAEVVIAVDAAQVLSDGGHALHGQKGIHFSVSFGPLRLLCGVDDSQPRALRELRQGAGCHFLRPGGIGVRPGHILPEGLALCRAGPQRQNHALHAAVAQAGQMMTLQYMVLPRQTPAGHIVEQIGMTVKNHGKTPFRVYAPSTPPTRMPRYVPMT